MGNINKYGAGIVNELDDVMMYIRLCQSAIGNKNYLELYPDIECVLGDINTRIQKVMDQISELDKAV